MVGIVGDWDVYLHAGSDLFPVGRCGPTLRSVIVEALVVHTMIVELEPKLRNVVNQWNMWLISSYVQKDLI